MRQVDEEVLVRARALAEQAGATLDQLQHRRVRVLRALVYEGRGDAVLVQLARSLPEGTRELHRREITITVTQDALHDLGEHQPPERPPVEAQARALVRAGEVLLVDVPATQDPEAVVAVRAGDLQALQDVLRRLGALVDADYGVRL